MACRPDLGDIKALRSQSLFILLLYISYCCRQYRNTYKKIERCSFREGRGARRDGGERGLVTGVRSGWGRASRAMRTKYYICQQFVVEFGRVPVNTDALLGEASRDTRLLADLQNDTSVLEHSGSVQIIIQCLNVLYIYGADTNGVVQRAVRVCSRQEGNTTTSQKRRQTS